MPKLDFAFLADAAEAEPGKKFYVLGGGVDSIGAQAFPVVHPHLALLIRVLIHPTESERAHTLEIRLIDDDGHELARMEGNFQAAGGPPGREMPMNISLALSNIRFERHGDYSIELLLDNQHVKSLPLRIYQVEQPVV
ncbi:MAG TPA: hypothetical protein VGW79_01025 [Actinomycetota bacterium]|nr:hypothetical protein [Actinomycetota bacterium]